MAVLALAACSDGTAAPTTTVAPWTLRPVSLELPGSTDEVPAEGDLPDGTYLGTLLEDPDTGNVVEFSLYRGWFAETCYEHFADEITAGEDRCLNDIELVPADGRTTTLSPTATVALTTLEYSEDEFVIDPEILASIARGEAQPDAPENWRWVPFFFLLQVRDGVATSATQFWTP